MKYLRKIIKSKLFRDIILIFKWLTCQKIEISSQRDVTDINYWNDTKDNMVISSVNKPRKELRAEKEKDKILFSEIEKLIEPKSILEVGCGFGYMLKKVALKYKDAEIYGCDYAESLIKEAKNNYLKNTIPQENLVTCSAINLEGLENKKFDVLITSGCLSCLNEADVEKALIEFKKYAKYMFFTEGDYTKLNFIESLRFKRDKNYPINDYEKIIKNVQGLKFIKRIWGYYIPIFIIENEDYIN